MRSEKALLRPVWGASCLSTQVDGGQRIGAPMRNAKYVCGFTPQLDGTDLGPEPHSIRTGVFEISKRTDFAGPVWAYPDRTFQDDLP